MFKKSKNGNGGSSPLSQIQDFYKFMVDQALETLEYSADDLHVRMVRRRTAPVQIPVPVMTTGMAIPTAASSPMSSAAGSPSLPPNASAVKAPMMGVFYRASTPSSPPFVRSGDSVKKGQVICLIEAMKVFNEVKADFDCTILQVLLDNGKPVKAGQDLFAVERK
jgi:acetyl-CoA carboxylase biotin carboxyl carrier protein